MTESLFGKRLHNLRLLKKLSQQELADKLNDWTAKHDPNNKAKISKSMISRWENGKADPQMFYVRLITNFFGVDPNAFIHESWSENDQIIDNSVNSNIMTKINDILPIQSKLRPERQQKVYTYAEKQLNEQQNPDNVVSLDEARAERNLDEPAFSVDVDGIVAAGYGAFNDDRDEPMDTVKIPDSAIPSHYDYCFKVVGDSMHPTYDDGEFVFVQKTQDVTNGMIAVVDIDDMTFIKKLIFEQDRLCLRSLNDDVDEKTGERIYPDFYADETDIIDVIGKVVGSYAFK